MEHKYLSLCPYGKQQLKRVVTECKRKIAVTACVANIALFFWNNLFEDVSGIYVLESMLLAVYLVWVEVPNYLIREKESKIEKELLMYFSRVKHRYAACKNIANAVLDGADGMSYEMQRLADEIYRVLMECDRKEKVREYIVTHNTNRYLKLFFIQVYEASEKGDTYFSENMEHLRMELMEEIYRKKKRSYEFAGYVFVAVVPFFSMPALKYWGLEFSPALGVFYAGTGMLLETITFAATILVYEMISAAKEIVLSGEDKGLFGGTEWIKSMPLVRNILSHLEKAKGKLSKAVRKLILRSGVHITYGEVCFYMILFAGCSLIFLTGFLLEIQKRERSTILSKVESIEMIIPVAGEEKQKIMSEHILAVTRQCILRREVKESEIRNMLRERIRLGNESMETEAVKEIQKKLEQYCRTSFSPGEILLCILCSAATGLIPVFKLYYRGKTIYAGAANEVRQMQSVILMERKIQGMTVLGLLKDMEVFAQNFRGCLRRCINAYGIGTKDALIKFKEEGKLIHESFEELADAFLSVDEVGIELAFDEIEGNRRLLEKLTQLEADINMEKKKDSTDLLARIPSVLAVGVYFIAPFFMHSLQGVFDVFELLENLQL